MAKRRARQCLVFCATTLFLLVAASPESPRIAAQGDSEVDGTLEVHYEDSQAGTRLRYYLDTGNERLSLAFARNPPRRLLSGTRVRARGARRNRTLTLATGEGLVVAVDRKVVKTQILDLIAKRQDAGIPVPKGLLKTLNDLAARLSVSALAPPANNP